MKKTNLFETLNNEELKLIKGGASYNRRDDDCDGIVDPDDEDDEMDEDDDEVISTGIIGGLNATSTTITP